MILVAQMIWTFYMGHHSLLKNLTRINHYSTVLAGFGDTPSEYKFDNLVACDKFLGQWKVGNLCAVSWGCPWTTTACPHSNNYGTLHAFWKSARAVHIEYSCNLISVSHYFCREDFGTMPVPFRKLFDDYFALSQEFRQTGITDIETSLINAILGVNSSEY